VLLKMRSSVERSGDGADAGPPYWCMAAMLLLLAAEAFLYSGFEQREISWFPPEGWDQAVYLSKAYQIQESLGRNGLTALWSELTSPDHSGGLFLPVEAGLLGSLLGGTRFPALMLNFMGLALAQVAMFSAVRHVTKSPAYGFVAIGLFLLESTTWNDLGGLFDFRFDFIATCLYGTWAAGVLRSDVFLSRRLSLVTGLVGAILVLHRYIGFVYVIGVEVGLLAVLAVLAIRRPDVAFALRCRNLAISTAIILIAFIPVAVRNWDYIYGKYVVRAVTGDESAVYAAMAGVSTLVENLLFYPTVALNEHLGTSFVLVVACLIAVSGALGTIAKRGVLAGTTSGLAAVFLVGASIGPLVVLTLVPAKAPHTAGIVGVPVAMLATVAAWLLAPRWRIYARTAAVAILGLGALYQIDQGVGHSPWVADDRGELREWNSLVHWLTAYAVDRKLVSPSLSTDITSSRISGPAFTAGGFEMDRTLVSWNQLLGGDILAVDRTKVMESLASSDVVILTSIPKTDEFPFHVALKPYWPELKKWADDNMRLARTFSFTNGLVWVYVRSREMPFIAQPVIKPEG
jgi:hypothetical protein